MGERRKQVKMVMKTKKNRERWIDDRKSTEKKMMKMRKSAILLKIWKKNVYNDTNVIKE